MMAGGILVFGRNGQVASELAALAPGRGLDLTLSGREDFDLMAGDPGEHVRQHRPAAVINASAYTAVDAAETDPGPARRLNAEVPGELARACAELGIPFVHFSTDYVFDGSQDAPYLETDALAPLGVYGETKAEGEAAVQAAGGRWAVLRTSWVFSAHGGNFIKTMLRLARERDEVGVVADQSGRPTWARDAALAALAAVDVMTLSGEAVGIAHVAGADDASWADLAEGVFSELDRRGARRPRLKRITTADFPTAARRPANSRLGALRPDALPGWNARPWAEALSACLDEIQEKQGL